MTLVQFVNESTVFTDSEVIRVMDALQIQANRDLLIGWGWGIDVVCEFVTYDKADPKQMTMVMLDNSDQAGALGYHMTTSTGAPLAKNFIGTDMMYGYLPSVTMSHEFMEMLVDPNANWKIMSPDMSRDYMIEVCDACEADEFSYQINGIAVSDFVLPPWFDMPVRSVPVRYDFCGHITAPFQLLDGGYIAYLDTKTMTWVQETGMKAYRQSQSEYASKSRFARLQIPRLSWTPSTRI